MRGDRPTRVEWIGLAIGFVGVVWLNAGSAGLAASKTGLVLLMVAVALVECHVNAERVH